MLEKNNTHQESLWNEMVAITEVKERDVMQIWLLQWIPDQTGEGHQEERLTYQHVDTYTWSTLPLAFIFCFFVSWEIHVKQ